MDRIQPKPNNTLLVIWGMLITTLIHGGLIYAALHLTRSQAQAAEEEPLDLLQFEAVELLMWGEVMPNRHRLPIVPNPAPEERPVDVVDINTPTSRDEEPVSVRQTNTARENDNRSQTTSRRRQDENQRQDSSRHNPNRPINNEPLWGSPDGYRGGTSLSPTAIANLFGPVQEQIQRAFRTPSSISANDLRRLNAEIRIYVNREGRITRFRWVQRSDNDAFDAAAERAINTFSMGSQRLRLPTHNEAAMDQAVQRGFDVMIRAEN